MVPSFVRQPDRPSIPVPTSSATPDRWSIRLLDGPAGGKRPSFAVRRTGELHERGSSRVRDGDGDPDLASIGVSDGAWKPDRRSIGLAGRSAACARQSFLLLRHFRLPYRGSIGGCADAGASDRPSFGRLDSLSGSDRGSIGLLDDSAGGPRLSFLLLCHIEIPDQTGRAGVDDRGVADGGGLAGALVDMAADDQHWLFGLDGAADGDAAEAGAGRGDIDGALGGRVGDQDGALGAAGEEALGLLLSEVEAPGAERGDGDAAAEAPEGDAGDGGAGAVEDAGPGPGMAGGGELGRGLAVAGHQDRGLVDHPEHFEGALETAADGGEVSGADDGVDFRRALDQPAGGAGVTVEVAEEEELHVAAEVTPGRDVSVNMAFRGAENGTICPRALLYESPECRYDPLRGLDGLAGFGLGDVSGLTVLPLFTHTRRPSRAALR